MSCIAAFGIEEDEALLVQQGSISVPTANQWEVLLAGFLQKQNSKEIKAFGNEESLQLEIDESKRGEWETLEGKTAVRVWKGAKAAAIRQKYGHRFIGSRFVVIRKTDEDGSRIKSRWCLQGHLDPDFHAKILSGACHSPTLHPLSRALVLQAIVSHKWQLQLGDVKGAFLEAGPIDPKFNPLYAHQPAGGSPDSIQMT